MKLVPPYIFKRKPSEFAARIIGRKGVLLGLDASAYFCPITEGQPRNPQLEMDKIAMQEVRSLALKEELVPSLPGNQYFEVAKASPHKQEEAKRWWSFRVGAIPQEIGFVGVRIKLQDNKYEQRRKDFEDCYHRNGLNKPNQKSDWSMVTNAKYFDYPVLTVDYAYLRNLRRSKQVLAEYVMRPLEFVDLLHREKNLGNDTGFQVDRLNFLSAFTGV